MKKILIFMLVSVLAFGMIGCSSEEVDPTGTGEQEVSEETDEVTENSTDEGEVVEEGEESEEGDVEEEGQVQEDSSLSYNVTYLKMETDDAGNLVPTPIEKHFANGDFDGEFIKKMDSFVEQGTEVLQADLPDTADTGALPTYSIVDSEGMMMSVWVNEDITFFAYDAGTFMLDEAGQKELKDTLETLFAEDVEVEETEDVVDETVEEETEETTEASDE